MAGGQPRREGGQWMDWIVNSSEHASRNNWMFARRLTTGSLFSFPRRGCGEVNNGICLLILTDDEQRGIQMVIKIFNNRKTLEDKTM